MARSQEGLIFISGRLHTSGTRCLLKPFDQSDTLLIKCPGLGAHLLHDVKGIPVRSGSPMIDVECELTGRFLDIVVPPFDSVLGDLIEITVYAKSGDPIPIDMTAIQNLNAAQLEDCEYFERRDGNTEMRQHFLSEREAW